MGGGQSHDRRLLHARRHIQFPHCNLNSRQHKAGLQSKESGVGVPHRVVFRRFCLLHTLLNHFQVKEGDFFWRLDLGRFHLFCSPLKHFQVIKVMSRLFQTTAGPRALNRDFEPRDSCFQKFLTIFASAYPKQPSAPKPRRERDRSLTPNATRSRFAILTTGGDARAAGAWLRGPRIVRMMRLPKGLRLLSVPRVMQIVTVIQGTLGINPGRAVLLRLFLWSLLFFHFATCAWFAVYWYNQNPARNQKP